MCNTEVVRCRGAEVKVCRRKVVRCGGPPSSGGAPASATWSPCPPHRRRSGCGSGLGGGLGTIWGQASFPSLTSFPASLPPPYFSLSLLPPLLPHHLPPHTGSPSISGLGSVACTRGTPAARCPGAGRLGGGAGARNTSTLSSASSKWSEVEDSVSVSDMAPPAGPQTSRPAAMSETWDCMDIATE